MVSDAWFSVTIFTNEVSNPSGHSPASTLIFAPDRAAVSTKPYGTDAALAAEVALSPIAPPARAKIERLVESIDQPLSLYAACRRDCSSNEINSRSEAYRKEEPSRCGHERSPRL
jgi:hypothetical protein